MLFDACIQPHLTYHDIRIHIAIALIVAKLVFIDTQKDCSTYVAIT